MKIGDWIIVEKDTSIIKDIKIAKLEQTVSLMQKQILELVEELRETTKLCRKAIKQPKGIKLNGNI